MDKRDESYTLISFFMFQRSVNSIVSGVQQYQAALLSTLRDKMKTILERPFDSMEQFQEEALATLDNFQDPFSIMATSIHAGQNHSEAFQPNKTSGGTDFSKGL